MDKTEEHWNGLHLGKFEKRRSTFFRIFRYVSVYMYQNFINTAGKSFSVVMRPWFCKWKTLGLPIWRLELIISKFQQNYLKQLDLAPLISTSYLAGLFDIFILLHIWQNYVCFGDFLPVRTVCDAYYEEFESH